MELMSSLLFCALTVLVPQASGEDYHFSPNDTIVINAKPLTDNNVVMDHNILSENLLMKSKDNQSEFDIEHTNKRNKRKAEDVQNNSEKKSKKTKVKKNKSFSIVKYEKNDKIYALRIKETHAHDNQTLTKILPTCQVYSVQKYYPCESPDADLIITAPKRKIIKKSRKERSKRQKNVSDAKTTVIAPVFTTRQIDSSQVPEQIMPSIEELY